MFVYLDIKHSDKEGLLLFILDQTYDSCPNFCPLCPVTRQCQIDLGNSSGQRLQERSDIRPRIEEIYVHLKLL